MESFNWIEWIILGTGILEVIGKAIPNPKINGPIGFIIDGLKFISDYFNRSRNY